MRFLLLFFLSCLFWGCAERPSPQAGFVPDPIPILDNSTPDRALHSWWAMRDWDYEQNRRIFHDARNRWTNAREAWQKVTTGDVAVIEGSDNLGPSLTFDRRIVDVKVETESRAVITVIISNVTPVDESRLSSYAQKLRREGDRFRYVLIKTDGWKVAEVFRYFSSGGDPLRLYRYEPDVWASKILH